MQHALCVCIMWLKVVKCISTTLTCPCSLGLIPTNTSGWPLMVNRWPHEARIHDIKYHSILWASNSIEKKITHPNVFFSPRVLQGGIIATDSLNCTAAPEIGKIYTFVSLQLWGKCKQNACGRVPERGNRQACVGPCAMVCPEIEALKSFSFIVLTTGRHLTVTPRL